MSTNRNELNMKELEKVSGGSWIPELKRKAMKRKRVKAVAPEAGEVQRLLHSPDMN